VVVSSELLAVVTAAHEARSAASVAVIDSAVPKPVTVALSLPAGVLRSAAPPPVIVPAPAPLAWGRGQGRPGHDDRGGGRGEVLGQVTAVVLLVVVSAELLAVVTAAHEVTLASSVAVIDSAV